MKFSLIRSPSIPTTMKQKYNSEKDELKIELTNAEMRLFGDFFSQKYLPYLPEDKYWTQQQLSILKGIQKRCSVMIAQNNRKQAYRLSLCRHEVVALIYMVTNVLNDDMIYPLLLAFASALNDTLYMYAQKMFFIGDMKYSLLNSSSGLPDGR